MATRMSEETTAFHEAGHAVAMRAMHRELRVVSIVADNDSVGRVVPRSPLRPFAWRDELFELQSAGIWNTLKGLKHQLIDIRARREYAD